METDTMITITNPPKGEDSKREISACERVFNIAELADAILLQLKMRDLLCGAQQTCQQWRSVIDSSPLIQELLFFQPIDSTLFHLVENGFLVDDKHSPVPFWADPDRGRTVIQHPYPLMLSRDPDKADHENESWRRQLITQPPLAAVEVCMDEGWNDMITVDGGVNGVRMGDLAALGPIYGIRGWSWWEVFKDYEQLRRVKEEEKFKG